MKKDGYRLGGEQSGHIILGHYATTGDGLLTATQLVEVMARRQLPLSRLSGAMRLYPQVLRSLPVFDQEAVVQNPAVRKAVVEASAALGEKGRILLRKSGTEPVVRVMVESEREEWCEHWADHISRVIQAQGLLCEGGR
jgi:phosphoglucosamine mutase